MNGGPAFPHVIEEEYDSGYHLTDVQEGMSLLDWFAGQALIGWVAHFPKEAEWPLVSPKACETVARDFYALAKAMLKIRMEENHEDISARKAVE